MLGDDMMDGTKRGVSIVAHAAKNVLKGALLFAAVVGAGYALGVAGSILFAEGVVGLGASIAEGASMLLSGAVPAAVGNTAGYAATAGLIGGAATGAASLLPGKDEGFSFRRSYRKLEEMGKGRGRDRVVEQETYTARDTSYSAPAPAYIPAPQPQPIIVQSPQQAPAPQAQPIIVHAQQPQQAQQPIVIVQQPAPQQAQHPLQLDIQQTAAAPLPQDAALAQPQEVAATTTTAAATGDNPYFRPGKGAELMQRGNEMQTTLSK